MADIATPIASWRATAPNVLKAPAAVVNASAPPTANGPFWMTGIWSYSAGRTRDRFIASTVKARYSASVQPSVATSSRSNGSSGRRNSFPPPRAEPKLLSADGC